MIKFLVNCGNKNLQYLLVPSRLDKALNEMDTDRDGVVRRAEFFDAVGAVNRVVPPERRIDGDSVWGLLDCNGDGELERNELERGLRI